MNWVNIWTGTFLKVSMQFEVRHFIFLQASDEVYPHDCGLETTILSCFFLHLILCLHSQMKYHLFAVHEDKMLSVPVQR